MEIEIGVITTGASAQTALAKNSQQMTDLIAEIGAMEVQPESVETARLNVEPQYSEDVDTDEIAGWQAENTLTIRYSNLAKAGEIVTALFESGGNNISTPVFSLTDATSKSASRIAETKALVEARDQAETVSTTLGMRISRVLLVSDSKVRFSRSGNSIVVTGSRIQRPVVPVEPAQVEITATYNVEFSLVPE